jgi:hypothetical protein
MAEMAVIFALGCRSHSAYMHTGDAYDSAPSGLTS